MSPCVVLYQVLLFDSQMEVAGLLQMACRHDNERMTERLLQQLSQAQSEAQLLQKKLHQYEELEVSDGGHRTGS